MKNVSIGVLGHVDCGKTSLVRVLSTTLSTASLDRHPQSRSRGITLDLGFSCIDRVDDHGERRLQTQTFSVEQAFLILLLQCCSGVSQTITLVDCPGHATLLRTIICGSRIVDGMMLVVDASKGIQTQTAECIVIAEVVNIKNVLVVFNKTDLVDEASLRATEQKVLKTLARTK
uniref:Tr-type G domain-containing protein n=1 Tax=Rhodosorus marinus TaxID=101924 RepID=A0A7S2ZCI6_9RHOD|mmetsp:Transcript_14691/g.59717  ORF Transcript_14691/g.59717 Transcript_14691/m.59717 type:complete len:174 (+) Transcript_14691:2098-2619(+)